MISREQIKAARAMLDWSQTALAEQCGEVSVPTIKLLESGRVKSNDSTINAIRRTFEGHGIEFIEGGVRFVPDVVQIIEGKDCYLKLLDDVFYTVRDTKNPELLISCADDKVSPPEINDKYRQIRKSGIKMRQIIQEGNKYILGPLDEYRYMPKKYFLNRVSLMYGSKFAIVLLDTTKVTILKDPVMAELQRNIFNFMWSVMEQPTETNAPERF